ncbi:MAG: recombination mediator RecR [Planctomycetota bacterium]
MAYPRPLEQLIATFERFPGVGRRSAERLAFHVLRSPEAQQLSSAIVEAVANTRRCGECGNVTEADPCAICSDPERDATLLMVVGEPRDVEALERARVFAGRYHVLMGNYQPAEGVDARHLDLGTLVERARGAREILLGTSPDAAGEATARLCLEALDRAGVRVRVTRLARGLPAGSALEYLHKGILEDAIEGRVRLRDA